jgi:hypothetical protein
MQHAIIKLSQHSSIYRGFTIVCLPRNKLNPVTRYQVRRGDDAFGKFDAQALATGYIDDLYLQKASIVVSCA